MPNSIALFAGFAGMLDEVYASSSLTAILDGASELARQGSRVNEMIVPKLTVQGLANYSRSDGYIPGDITLTHETITCGYDRGRMFTVDAMDDEETAGVAFGQLAGEFIRTRVTPELDAYRFAKYAQSAGHSVQAYLSTGAEVLAALRDAANYMDAAEVPLDGRVLFIASPLLGLVEDLDTTVSRAALSRFEPIVRAHPSRFYESVVLNDGITGGQQDGGFSPAADAMGISFLAAHRDAVVQFTKHAEPKVIPPRDNQAADAWKFGYRLVSAAWALESKTSGIYAHLNAEPPEPEPED
ncbi:MAG: hypothetical protein LBS11_00720 [Oscillospiraceae bacterium]|jgi:hypothetical protein|nr:hypothetical protein [Oscillospiraceae bacterium]